MRTALTRQFARHYVEMVLVMLVGMAVLAVPARLATDALLPGVDGDDTTLMLARMGVIMTLPMIPWMRWRGHGWRPTLEMAAAMIVPALAVIGLYAAAVLDGVGLLMTVEHVAMFAAMFGVMIARPDEYSHAHLGRHVAAPVAG
jgi:flagellar biosynthetic protein FliP